MRSGGGTMGNAKGAGVPWVRWLLEAGVLFVAWQNYATGTMPRWFALPLACLMSVIYGVSWASRLRYLVRGPRGRGAHRKDADLL